MPINLQVDFPLVNAAAVQEPLKAAFLFSFGIPDETSNNVAEKSPTANANDTEESLELGPRSKKRRYGFGFPSEDFD